MSICVTSGLKDSIWRMPGPIEPWWRIRGFNAGTAAARPTIQGACAFPWGLRGRARHAATVEHDHRVLRL
jgi:hypothetical protein